MIEIIVKVRCGMIIICYNMCLSFWVYFNGIVLVGGRGVVMVKSGC